ncbi:MAG: metalloendopeptidase [Magnetospirillum sp.]|nr:metalloendopeptidase [Magnetospirillum sp.]
MDSHKLAKVLALAASDNEAEALHALRTAKRLLATAGADFVDLGRRLAEPAAAPSSGEVEALEDAVFDLRNELRHLKAENERLRQRGGGDAVVPAGSLADAAKDAAQAIRLRAEAATLVEQLTAARAELARAERAEERLAARLEEADREIFRLMDALTDAEAQVATLTIELSGRQTPAHAPATAAPRGKPPAAVRGKVRTAGQYALF